MAQESLEECDGLIAQEVPVAGGHRSAVLALGHDYALVYRGPAGVVDRGERGFAPGVSAIARIAKVPAVVL
jgi:hypothetical protein